MLRFGDGITVFGALVALAAPLWGSKRPASTEPDPLPRIAIDSGVDDAEETIDFPDGLDWPDDCDAVPSWRHDAERRAAEIGLVLPTYRTARDYEHRRAMVIASLSPPDPLPALSAQEAAIVFLDHLRQRGSARLTNEQMTEAYLQFCHDMNRTPSPENFVRQNLRTMVGVTTSMVDGRTPDGKRVRSTLWTVVPYSDDSFREAA